jgi:hypothetical protein
MNWFERYGIAGSYTLALVFSYLTIFFHCLLQANQKILPAIGALFLLPAGYLVSILALWFIYHLPFERFQIHRNIINHLRTLGIQNIPTEAVLRTELQAETWLAMRFREEANGTIQQSRGLVMEWARKRWDVLGINASLLLSSYLFILISLVTLCAFCRNNMCYNESLFYLSLLIVLVVVLVTHASRRLMRNQLLLSYLDFFPRYFRIQNPPQEPAPE